MTREEIIEQLVNRFDGVTPKSSWGETSLFYNPGGALPNGVYFCTIKEKDGENDKSSKLDRDGVFRLSIGVGNQVYEQHFGARPPKPSKGGIVNTGHDFTLVDELMPHPIYGWMAWMQVLSPKINTFDSILPLIAEAHSNAVKKFNKKMSSQIT